MKKKKKRNIGGQIISRKKASLSYQSVDIVGGFRFTMCRYADTIEQFFYLMQSRECIPDVCFINIVNFMQMGHFLQKKIAKNCCQHFFFHNISEEFCLSEI